MMKTMEKTLVMLGELEYDDLDWMLKVGKHEWLPAGHILIHEHQPLDSFYILLDGELGVSTRVTGADDIATLRNGQVVGELSSVEPRIPTATITVKRSSLILTIPRTLLVRKLQQDVTFTARFYEALVDFLSRRILQTTCHLAPVTPASPHHTHCPEVQDSLALEPSRLDWLRHRIQIQFQTQS